MKKPKHKNRIHKSHIKSTDWKGFCKRNFGKGEKREKDNIYELYGYLAGYELIGKSKYINWDDIEEK